MEPDDGTVPLDDTFAEVVEFHGRMYQKYALTNETYFSPVDERETARLEQMHRIFNQVFDNRLIFPPVASPRRVLDLGCGGGDWASAVAEELPRASVLGIDASPHMLPEDPPDNLELQVDDLNARFTFQSDRYDIAHSQMVAGGIHATRWESYIRDIFRVLKPDGWCQMVEIYFNAQSDNGRLTRDHALSKWSSNYLQGVQPYKNPRAPLQIANWMRNAGFTEVESKLLVLPMCGWSSSPRDRAIGQAMAGTIRNLLHTIGLYPMVHFKGMPIEEFEILVEDASAEANDPSFKAYFPLYVCIGKKPRSRAR